MKSELSKYLQSSTLLYDRNCMSLQDIINGLRTFLPSYSHLPIEIKTLIISFFFNKKKPMFYNIKKACHCIDTIIAFCGKETTQILQNIFKRHPQKILKDIIGKQDAFNNNIENVYRMFSNLKDIVVYSWNKKNRKFICFLDDYTCIKNINFLHFKQFREIKEDKYYFSVHNAELCSKRKRFDNKSSFDEYYVEGIQMDKFMPTHFVEKKKRFSFTI